MREPSTHSHSIGEASIIQLSAVLAQPIMHALLVLSASESVEQGMRGLTAPQAAAKTLNVPQRVIAKG